MNIIIRAFFYQIVNLLPMVLGESDGFYLLKKNLTVSGIYNSVIRNETLSKKFACLSKCSQMPLCESVIFDSNKNLCSLLSTRFENLNTASDGAQHMIYLKKRSYITGEIIQTFDHGSTCWNLYLLKNGFIACAAINSQIKIWNTYENRIEKVFIGHTQWATRIIELSDGSLASGSSDKNVIIWDYDANQAKISFTNQHSRTISGLSDLKNGLIASGSVEDRKCFIWNYSNVLPNGLLAIALNNEYIELWNVTILSFYMMLYRGGGASFKMGLIGNDILVASGSWGHISAFNLTTNQRISYFQAHNIDIRGLKILKNGYVASGSSDTSIKIWNVFTAELIKTISIHSSDVVELGLTDNGYLVSSAWDSSGSSFPPIKICYP